MTAITNINRPAPNIQGKGEFTSTRLVDARGVPLPLSETETVVTHLSGSSLTLLSIGWLDNSQLS